MGSAYQKDGNSPPLDPASEFLEFWRNYFEMTASQTRTLFETMRGGKSADQLHNQWMGTLSDSLDDFMRTPAFLEALKQSLKRMIDLKQAQDQMAQTLAQQTGMPLAADITGVFERVKSSEQVILKKLEQIDDRLKTIESALNISPVKKKSPTSQKEGNSRREGR